MGTVAVPYIARNHSITLSGCEQSFGGGAEMGLVLLQILTGSALIVQLPTSDLGAVAGYFVRHVVEVKNN